MSFYVADAINGRTLDEGAPVVTFLVNYQGGHYPLDANPNALLARPAERFALESLPIFGTAADCGRVEVDDESSLSVRLALRVTGCESWKQLTKEALHGGRGVQSLGREGEQYRRIYGLCTLHRETYEYLRQSKRSRLANSWCPDGYPGLNRDPAQKASDIEQVLSIMTRCMTAPGTAFMKKGPGAMKDVPMEGVAAAFNLARICMLSADSETISDAFPDEANLPSLLTALSSRDGRLFGGDFHALMLAMPILGHKLMASEARSADQVLYLPELLSQMWDCVHLGTRVDELNAQFQPSVYSGQDRNYGFILEFGRATFESVWSELVDKHLDCHGAEENIKALDDELARMEATLAKMRARLVQGRRDAKLPD